MNAFQLFCLLQVLDLLTTVVVLKTGGQELNPLLCHFMNLGAITGLMVGKVAVVGIGAFVAYIDRPRVLRIASVFYGAIVVWNTFVLILLQMKHA